MIGNGVHRRPDTLAVHSLDHFALTVPDLAEAVAFYSSFGLDVRSERSGAGIYTFDAPHRWGMLLEGSRKRFAHLSFGLFEQDFPAFRVRLKQMGIAAIAPPAGTDSDGVWFHDDEGNLVEVAVREKSSPGVKSLFRDVSSPPGIPGAPLRSKAPQTRPRRLGHIALYTADVNRKIDFFCSVLGLRLSDRVGNLAAFLHGPHGSDHHMLALVHSDGPGFHHCSWDVGSINEVGIGAEQMIGAGYDKGWGVGRHVLGSNYFYYITDPWGSHSEYSADMDYVPAGFEWDAHDHAPEDAFTLWGNQPPAGFMTNFELA